MERSGKGIIREHFRLLDFIQETPRPWGEIIKEMGWNKSTLSDRLNILIELKKIKQLEDKRYASFDYEDVDEKIKSVVKGNGFYRLSEEDAPHAVDKLWDEALKPHLEFFISEDNEPELKDRFRKILKEAVRKNRIAEQNQSSQ